MKHSYDIEARLNIGKLVPAIGETLDAVGEMVGEKMKYLSGPIPMVFSFEYPEANPPQEMLDKVKDTLKTGLEKQFNCEVVISMKKSLA